MEPSIWKSGKVHFTKFSDYKIPENSWAKLGTEAMLCMPLKLLDEDEKAVSSLK